MATYNPAAIGVTADTTGGTFNQGAWYGGRQYWNGTLGEVGAIHPESNQKGAGQAVSDETIKATNPDNVAYLNTLRGGTNPANNGGSNGATGMSPTGVSLDQNPEYAALTKSINDRTTAYSNALTEINDNPFYSAGRRTGEQAKIDQEYNADMTNLNNQKSQFEKNAATSFDQLQKLISDGALAGASDSDLSAYSHSTGIPVSMLKSVANSNNNQLIQSTDAAGNLTIATVNKNTGKVVNQTTLNGVGKATATATAKADGTATASSQIADAAKLIAQYRNTNTADPNWASAHSLRQNYSPADFLKSLETEYPEAIGYVKSAFPEGVTAKTKAAAAPL